MPTPTTRELYDQYVIPTYARFDLRLARGRGTEVWDEDGKRYLDFGAGIAVTSIGHAHPRVIAAMQQQIATLVHTSNLYYTRPQALLAERLVRLTCTPAPPRGKVFFCNSGAEANEALYKLARKFGNDGAPPAPKHNVGETVGVNSYRHEIVTMIGSFHGRTLAGIAATGQEKVKKGFEPPVQGFSHVPFNDGPALLAAVQEPGTVAVLLEPIQGEIGVNPATADFLQMARDLCDRHGLLLMFDEVQCGLGRTGDWCGWKTLAGPDLMPDAISWAKGIAGGFPLGAIWVSDRMVTLKTGETKPLCDLLGPGTHGTTFGGTPLVSSGANEVLSVIEEEGMLENARTMGAHAVAAIQAIQSPLIKEVRGVGLMLAFELVPDFVERVPAAAKRAPSLLVVDALHEAGLLNVPSGTHAVRWLPPLNVSRAEIDEAADILRQVLAKF
ncbi:aspartate aminotransferase family protein [Chthoniobacter flavus]|uniref:aspartate aminotransferase family protein n=1 Tax=Chthoniobacter flavus TaxID=191863 RepID=UPI001051236D|nr:aminotransferase class III-fold pyridoxal phosphate-dependent enzyme [Chthoniobacter flavus]